jgi:hypothetical protein
MVTVKDALIQELEAFLHREDFGRNWDGAYQDVIPAIRRYFDSNGFETRLLKEWETPSGETELVASKGQVTVRVPWTEDRNNCSVVQLQTIQVLEATRADHASSGA